MVKKKSESEILEIAKVFEKYKNQVVINDKIIGKSNETWVAMSKQVNMSAIGLYTVAKKGYFGIHEILGLGIKVKEPDSTTEFNQSDETDDETLSSSNDNISEYVFESYSIMQDTFDFCITIPHEQFYSNMAPRSVLYRSKMQTVESTLGST